MQNMPPEYETLWHKIAAVIGPNRNSVLIGFDGESCSGKSSAASWLAWQFGMPTIHFDLFRVNPGDLTAPIRWRVDEIKQCIASRGDRCLIVESVLLLDALKQIGRVQDYLIFVENASLPPTYDDREFAICNQTARYFARESPKTKADYILTWEGI